MAQYFQIAGQSVLPYDDPQSRAAYHVIATGEVMPASWYRQFGMPEETINIAEVVENMETQASAPAYPPADAHIEDDHYEDIMDVSRSSSTVSDNLQSSLETFGTRLVTLAQENPDMEQCIKKFTKNLSKAASSNDENICRTL